MYHVRKALINMPKSMELEKYYEWLEKEEGIGERVSKQWHCVEGGSVGSPAVDQLQARQLVDNLMVSNDEDISNKISYFLDLIAQKVCYCNYSDAGVNYHVFWMLQFQLSTDVHHFFDVLIPISGTSRLRSGTEV